MLNKERTGEEICPAVILAAVKKLVLSQGPSCSYLGNAGDNVWVFAGVVFLITAEYSNFPALQNVDLWGKRDKEME